MVKLATITFINDNRIDLYKDTYIHAVKNSSNIDRFNSQVVFSNTLNNHISSISDLDTSDFEKVILGIFAECDFFKISDIQDLYFKCSSIHSINFLK
ncbi:hypothetical protein CD110_04650 [Staphylococcus casei]|uniref:hypothetical protein n=1 Tax=Staphylococcus TaxID=1279 RepID=UPI000CD07F5F|nr:hypothetical protein [Staphylococcus casei]PNZ60517.1 hypothetical protein CD110_04650 [Staphylococcus casei]WJE85751.1 hypothetical protein QMO72_10050 [Staphylococcus casei]